MRLFAIAAVAIVLSGCSAEGGPEPRQTEPFSEISADEAVRFTGTEPFWGGEVVGERLRYSVPENIDGTVIRVDRFAGNNGLSFSGRLDGKAFDMMVTPGRCSDGMSDFAYPYTVTLSIGPDEQRQGCAWTDRNPKVGPERS